MASGTGTMCAGTGYCITGSLLERAAIPKPQLAAIQSGFAPGSTVASGPPGQINVDGKFIQGGAAIGGTSGFELAGMGFPAQACAAFPLFCGSNKQYQLYGWQCMTNPAALPNYPVI